MAPAHSASASAGADSIKGLAQSIAKPAYRRLLNAEPALRRAVPVLIIAFLLTMAVSALVQVNDHRRQAVANIVRNLELTADLGAERLGGDNRLTNADLAKKVNGILEQMHQHRAGEAGIAFLVADADGIIIAGSPKTPALGRPLLDTLGAGQPLTTFGASAGVLEIPLPDGTPVFATVRS